VAGPFEKDFFVFLYFYFNGLSETNFQIWRIYFRQVRDLVCLCLRA
jgi:hypothetical protein